MQVLATDSSFILLSSTTSSRHHFSFLFFLRSSVHPGLPPFPVFFCLPPSICFSLSAGTPFTSSSFSSSRILARVHGVPRPRRPERCRRRPGGNERPRARAGAGGRVHGRPPSLNPTYALRAQRPYPPASSWPSGCLPLF